MGCMYALDNANVRPALHEKRGGRIGVVHERTMQHNRSVVVGVILSWMIVQTALSMYPKPLLG